MNSFILSKLCSTSSHPSENIVFQNFLCVLHCYLFQITSFCLYYFLSHYSSLQLSDDNCLYSDTYLCQTNKPCAIHYTMHQSCWDKRQSNLVKLKYNEEDKHIILLEKRNTQTGNTITNKYSIRDTGGCCGTPEKSCLKICVDQGREVSLKNVMWFLSP